VERQPVSWGINYLPGWGRQLDADQIIREVRDLGLSALEYQPGLFPEDAQAARPPVRGRPGGPAPGWIPVALAKADHPVTSTQRSRCPTGSLDRISR
jgi:inosose dehydratase